MSTRAGATILLLLCTSPLAAQGTASGSTPEDSVRAVDVSRAQALLRADTAALSLRIFVRRDGRWQAVAMQQTLLQ